MGEISSILRRCIVCLCIFIVLTGTLRLPWLRVFRVFSSVVRQTPGYNPQYGTRLALFQNFCVVLCIVGFVPFYVFFVCKCVLYYCHRVAARLQLQIYYIHSFIFSLKMVFNPLNAELNPICYFLALLGNHHFLHVSRIRVKPLILRLLMSYIYEAPILDVSRSHTTTHHGR